jgi:hypothetical protein
MTLLALAVPGLGGLVLLRRRDRVLRSVLEISAFSIAEIAEDGTRRALSWNQPLLLVNRPRRNQFEIMTADRTSALKVEYDRVGFYRAADLIVQYGGFTSDEPGTETSDSPNA